MYANCYGGQSESALVYSAEEFSQVDFFFFFTNTSTTEHDLTERAVTAPHCDKYPTCHFPVSTVSVNFGLNKRG